MNKLGAVVLCGGMSKRMGRPKAWLPFGGERLLQRTVRILGERAAEIVIVAAEGQALPELPSNCRVVTDAISGRGPLQGMAAGFSALSSEVGLAYVTSTDVPFLKPDWIDRLVELMGDFDLAMPFVGGFHHPLASIYRIKAVLPAIDALLKADRLRPFFLTQTCRARIVEAEELRLADPTFATLKNLNTPADYHSALEEAGLGLPSVTVELFGAPRLKAGFAKYECKARTAGEALASLAEVAPVLAPTLLSPALRASAYKLNLNADRFVEEEDMLVEGDSLLLFSADVGG